MKAAVQTNAGEFLFDQELIDRIRHVAGGEDVRCAVAFWSEDGVNRVFDTHAAACCARIVCDISMGSTSESALKALGAPNRNSLRHQFGLHSKVYMSDRGLVVGSANASISALSDGEAAARLTEAAIYHAAGSAAWFAATNWFETVYGPAQEIDDDALEWARSTYRPPRTPGSRPPRPGSLLDAVRLDPERFAGLGFVFTSVATTENEREAARESAKKMTTNVGSSKIDKWPQGGFFTGWKASEAELWPTLFFEFWQPARALTVFAKTVRIHDKRNRSVMARSAWSVVERQLGIDLPTRSAIARADAELAKKVCGGRDGILFMDAHALARRLVQVERESRGRKSAA